MSLLVSFGSKPLLLLHSEAEQAKQAPAKKRGRQKAPEPPGALASCVHHVAPPQLIEASYQWRCVHATDNSIFAFHLSDPQL